MASNNDKTVLLGIEFDTSNFEKEAKRVSKEMTDAIAKSGGLSLTIKPLTKKQVTDFTKDLNAQLKGQAKITPEFVLNKAALKRYIDDLSDALDTALSSRGKLGRKGLDLKINLDLTQAKKDLAAFIASGHTMTLPVAVVAPGTPAAPAGPTAPTNKLDAGQITLDAAKVASARRELELLRASLRDMGLTEKDVILETQKLETQIERAASTIDEVRAKNDAINKTAKPGAMVTPVPLSDSDILRSQKAAEMLDLTTTRITTFNKAQAQMNSNVRAGNQFLQSFAFQVGILGFSMGIFGGQLKQLGTSMFQFIRQSGDATSALKTMRDIVQGNILTQEKFNQIRQDLRSTDSALTKAFGTNRIEILKEQGRSGREIVEGLKANLSEQDKALLKSAEGWDRFDLAFKNVRKTMSTIFAPAVEKLADFLEKRLSPAVDSLVVKFNNLSKGQKSFISGLAIGVPTILTVLGSVGITLGGLLGIAAAIGQSVKVLRSVGALASSAGAAEAGEVAKAVASAFRFISESTGPIGLALTLLLAFITNFAEFRDKVMSGFSDIYDSVKKLIDVLQPWTEGKLAGFLGGVLQFLEDIAALVVGTIGDAIGALLGWLGDIINLVANIVDAFNADTWEQMAKRLRDAFLTFLMNGFQRLFRVILTAVEGLVKTISGIMEKLGLVNKGFTDETVKTIEDFKNKVTNTKLAVKDFTIVLDEQTKTIGEHKGAVEDDTAKVEEFRIAMDNLTVAAFKAREEIFQTLTQSNVKGFQTTVKNIGDMITQMTDQAVRDVEKIFTSQEDVINRIGKAIDDVKSKLPQLQAANAGAANSKLVGDLNAEAANNTGLTGTLLDALKKQPGNFSGPASAGAGGAILVNGVLGASSVEEMQKQLTVFEQWIELARSSKTVSNDLLNQAKTVVDWLRNKAKITLEEIQQANDASSETIRKAVQKLEDTQKARTLFIQQRKAQQQLENQIADNDEQLAQKRARIAELNDRVANFELTASQARQRRRDLEIEIAKVENQKDLDKANSDLAKIDPNDIDGITAKQRDIENIRKSLSSTIDKINNDFNREEQASGERVKQGVARRLQDIGNTVDNIIKPFTESIYQLFGQFVVNGASTGLDAAMTNLRIGLNGIADSVPGLREFVRTVSTAVNTGDVEKFVDSFVKLKQEGIDAEFNENLRNARNQMQAILLSLAVPFEDGSGNSVFRRKGPTGIDENNALLTFLGLNPDQMVFTQDEIVKRIQELDISKLFAKAAELESERQGGVLKGSAEEVLGLTALIDKLRTLLAEKSAISEQVKKDTLNALDKVIERVISGNLESKLSEIDADLARMEKADADRTVTTDYIAKQKLQVQQIEFNFKRADINAQYRAIELLREEKNAEKQKQILADLENERVRMRAEAERQIQEITGTKTTLKPINAPGGQTSGTEGSTDAPTKARGIFDQLRELTKGLEGTKLVNQLDAISRALNELFKNARLARQGMQDLFNQMANGELFLDAFSGWMNGAVSLSDMLATGVATAFAMVAQSMANALVDMIVNGESFLKSFKKFLGQMLISVGTAILNMAASMAAVAFFHGLMHGGIIAAFSEMAAVLPMVAVAVGVGAALVAAGAAMGGGGAGAKASSTNATNKGNAAAGATGDKYDPNKDAKTIFQKQMATQIYIDIRHDDGIIVKKVIKAVNQNGRLSNLIGNRRLGFGY